MSTTLATLMVGLGYDLSALEKGAPEAFRIVNEQTLGMSAEMKRNAREGAESLRLISENLGLHVSRPLSRILTQEFPAFASGLQAVLGGAVFGAVADIGFRAFEKVSSSIEHARKAEDELEASTRKVGEVFSDAMQSYEKADKLRSLSGLDKKIFEVDYSSIEEGRKKVDELAAAMDKEAKAAANAHKWTTELLAGIGEAAHVAFNTESSLGIEQIDKHFAEILQHFNELSKLDALHGTAQSAAYIAEEITKANQAMEAMKAANLTGKQVTGGDFESGFTYSETFSSAQLEYQTQYIANLQKISELLKASSTDKSGAEGEARKAEYAAQQLKAEQAIAALYREMGSSLAKLQPETDPIKKLDAEIAGFRSKAEEDFRAIGASAASALATSAALAGLDTYEKRLEQLKAKLEADIYAKQALDLLNKPIPGLDRTATATPISIATPAAAPTLGAGGTTGAQLDAFAKDLPAQLKAAAAAYADIVTPQQKYQLAQQELNILLERGLIDQTAYTAAMQKAGEEMTKGTDRLEKLLAKTDSASAGVEAFFLKLNSEANQNGKFAFDLLNQGLKGFEDELTKAVFTGKTQWEDLFRSLTESAFKFLLNKEISGFFQMMSGTGFGKSIGLGNLLPGAGTGGAGGATLAAASTTLQSGSTVLLTAATQLQAAASTMLASGGAGGGVIGDLTDSGAGSLPIPGFATGTDSAPGGLAWVGEQGPELLNLPGGTSVTPSSATRGGGEVHYYDQRGAVVTEDLMRKGDAVRMMNAMRPGIVGEAAANVSEIARRTVAGH